MSLTCLVEFANRGYNPFEEEVLTCGLVYLLTCSRRFRLGNRKQGCGQTSCDHAIEVIQGETTKPLESVRLQIKSVAGSLFAEFALPCIVQFERPNPEAFPMGCPDEALSP
jgi:hypothetical protein